MSCDPLVYRRSLPSVIGDAGGWERRSASVQHWPKLALDVDHLAVSQGAGKCRISAAERLVFRHFRSVPRHPLGFHA